MADKQLGQHWLFDTGALKAVGNAAGVESGDTVLEIGPGLGTLTKALLARGAQVIAVELDRTLGAKLTDKLGGESLEMVEADFLDFDLRSLPSGYKVAANIPYYITSPIIMKLLESPYRPEQIGLLVQKEVAQRLAAEPGQLSVIGVAAQALAEVRLQAVVPATLFKPPPKVDSQIISLKPRLKSIFTDHAKTMKLVKAGFLNRRKTLVNSLASTLPLTKETILAAVVDSGHLPTVRAQELALPDWQRLSKTLSR